MFLKAFSANRTAWIFIFGLLAALISCRQQPVLPSDPVARVGNAYLERSELQTMMPAGLAGSDSADIARKRVLAWVGHQIMLQKAAANLNEAAGAAIEKQIEQYREDLVVYFYEEQLTRKLLDTVVQDAEIEEYYNANQSQFVLKSDIVRLRFVQLPEQAKTAPKIESLLFADSLSEKDLYTLAELCGKESGHYFLDGDTWLPFSDVVKEIPIQAYDRNDFLGVKKKITLKSDGYMYYVSILDFKVRDMVSPLSFEKERIKNIILNLRKRGLLRQAETDLMQEATEAGLVEIYYN